MRIKTTCIDSGGSATASVLAFCKPRLSRRILAIKGMSDAKPIWPLRATKTRDNNKVFMIAVDTSKDVIYSRLKIVEGPGQIHFQAGICDSEFFAQLTSEVPSRRWKGGKPYRVWIPKTGVRNEVWDCLNYALAARMSLPFSDGMLQPPKTIYIDEKGDKILRGKKVEPTTKSTSTSPRVRFRLRSKNEGHSPICMRGTIVAQIAISQADKSVQKREIIMGKHLFLDFGDATNAICRHCGHPFGSWSVIEKGSCPECHAVITKEERLAGWCVGCGGALRSDEAGMEQCWNCVVGVD